MRFNAAIILSPGLQLSNLIIVGCGIERLAECGDDVGEQAGVSTRGEPGDIGPTGTDRNLEILHWIRSWWKHKHTDILYH